MKLNELISKMNSIVHLIISKLFSTRAGALYMLIFAVSIGAATFIENDFGTSSAQELIFRSRWFEILLFLFAGSIVNNIIVFRLAQNKKWASLLFHSSILIILLGAAVTRYFGYEGMMHIREGSSQNQFSSSETYLNLRFIKDGKKYRIHEPVYFSSLGFNKFDEVYQIGKEELSVRLLEFVPNPTTQLLDDDQGLPTIKLVIAGQEGREEYYLPQGETKIVNGTNYNFSLDQIPGSIHFSIQNDSLFVKPPVDFQVTVMATQEKFNAPALQYNAIKTRALYSNGTQNFVIPQFVSKAKLVTASLSPKVKNESMVGLKLAVASKTKTEEIFVIGRKGELGEEKVFDDGTISCEISYGSKMITVPFELGLRDFILEKYPGTDNPSSYASEVTLLDSKNSIKEDHRIYMNHILNYGGYRFFQSSYDPDEKGTYLSVNHDFWGTWISYLGYALLTVGLILIYFSKNTRLSELKTKLSRFQLILLVIAFCNAESLVAQTEATISQEFAKELSSLVVQDHKGRFKPFNTQAEEILRKLSKKSKLGNLNAEQVFFSMMMNPGEWEKVPMIHIGTHPQLVKKLGLKSSLAAYSDLFDEQNQYKLKEDIRQAQQMNPKDQTVWEKAVIKLDEKVNIANMVFSGRLFRIFPIPEDQNNTWASISDLDKVKDDLTLYRINFVKSFFTELQHAAKDNNYAGSIELLQQLKKHQKEFSGTVMPSDTKVTTEIKLNQLSAFSWLRNIYGLLGLSGLILFLFHVISHSLNREKITKAIFYVLLVLFVFHTIALAMRWYVSGHAPWSNGYESMIYIAWTTVLAALLFSRNSIGGLVAGLILAATILLVAHMSWMDPEITPLVPVLKSYWLTIHVSLEAGSYGFLMLGAVISMINLLLICFAKESNKVNIERTLKELTIISEITITGGLIMVSIGTYLGGVWANESWGRYWGWDAKETWALVTILVYAFILHMRFIPALRGLFAYNIATLFGFATVIMTYYGVNYYLSGLHSYAAGDPVPIPPQVYITAACLLGLSLFAYWRFKKYFSSNLMI